LPVPERSMSEFGDIVDTEGLDPQEEARLRRVHELLVSAGPPPDLPPSLERTPEAAEAEIVQFPLLPRRRWAVAALVAATLVAVAFGGGYLLGHSRGGPSDFAVKHIVPMHSSGSGNSQGFIRVSARDEVGNWPMELVVSGLPAQSQREANYKLWLTKNHKPTELCGVFRVHGDTTKVRFSVPYDLKGVDGWVVTAQPKGAAGAGPVVLTT
jgi:hypothetical protein